MKTAFQRILLQCAVVFAAGILILLLVVVQGTINWSLNGEAARSGADQRVRVAAEAEARGVESIRSLDSDAAQIPSVIAQQQDRLDMAKRVLAQLAQPVVPYWQIGAGNPLDLQHRAELKAKMEAQAAAAAKSIVEWQALAGRVEADLSRARVDRANASLALNRLKSAYPTVGGFVAEVAYRERWLVVAILIVAAGGTSLWLRRDS